MTPETQSVVTDIASSKKLPWRRINAVVQTASPGYVEPEFVEGVEIHIHLGQEADVWWREGGPYRKSKAAPGKTVVLHQRSYSERVWAAEATYLRIGIPHDIVADDDALAEMIKPGHWVLSDDPYHGYAKLIRDEIVSTAFCSDLVSETLVMSILEGSQTPDAAPHSFSPRQMREVIEYLIEHYDQSISVATLAKTAGMSPSVFSRAFRSVAGFAPYEFALRLRVERSKTLLKDDGMTGAAVAAAVGYHDESHFSRSFKRMTGLTPSEWRARTEG